MPRGQGRCIYVVESHDDDTTTDCGLCLISLSACVLTRPMHDCLDADDGEKEDEFVSLQSSGAATFDLFPRIILENVELGA